MVTLISQKTGSNRTRTCSARCYNAKGPVCCCICDCMNHGVGLQKAMNNTSEVAEELVKKKLNVQMAWKSNEKGGD